MRGKFRELTVTNMPNIAIPEGLDTPDLECVMLDLGPLEVREAFGEDFREKDLFYGPSNEPKLSYAQGAVAEKQAHVTLLFGIHPSETYVDDVMDALGDWEPEDIFIKQVGYFPSSIPGQDYHVIVGEVVPSANILLARKRLETLPHTDRFGAEYKPHVTLAYIKGKADLDKWVTRMNVHYARRVLTPTALNLGLD